jgi:hypothetical protein
MNLPWYCSTIPMNSSARVAVQTIRSEHFQVTSPLTGVPFANHPARWAIHQIRNRSVLPALRVFDDSTGEIFSSAKAELGCDAVIGQLIFGQGNRRPADRAPAVAQIDEVPLCEVIAGNTEVAVRCGLNSSTAFRAFEHDDPP